MVLFNANGFDEALEFTRVTVFLDTLTAIELPGGRRLRLGMWKGPDVRLYPGNELDHQVFEKARDQCREAGRIGSSDRIIITIALDDEGEFNVDCWFPQPQITDHR